MPRSTLLRQRLLTLFLLALLALYSPLVGQFESFPAWRGIPALYLYLFGVWGAIIAAAWILSRGRE